ncbi:MAG: ABC transporter ATP-binding protein [Tissierellia bacterium]|nr:ABC transporter ATP-binding protein [Tissierellia bacterium]
MLEVKNITKKYDNKEVLKDVSFDVKNGEIVTILGKNGAGKTTILNSILKMIKIDSGEIIFDERNIFSLKNKQYFKDVSAVLESSVNVYNYLTGMENIEYFCGLSNIDLNKKENKDLVYKYAKLFKLEDDLYKKVDFYSRGMQQKLAIIIALVVKPKLLLLDEPTLGLDIESKWTMIDFIKKVVKENNISIILTTHQIEIVRSLNSRVVLLKDGKSYEYELIDFLTGFKDEYIITYIDDYNNLVTKKTDCSIKEIIEKYKDYDIKEIRKVDMDIEKIVMEKLNESN